MTDDAPERIWQEPSYNAFGDHHWKKGFEGVGVEYIRADLANALVVEAYELAAVIASDNAPATVKASAIRALTPADAMAARDARDKQVRVEALREAQDACIAEYLEGDTDTEEDEAYDNAVADCVVAILALIPADQEGYDK